MASKNSKFRNVTLCEDIRDEVGNKKSLMGIFSGDVLVAELPATIQVAFYMEYVPGPDDGTRLNLAFRVVQGDDAMASGTITAPINNQNPVQLIISRGLATFDKETTLRVLVKMDGDAEETEILSKKIIKNPAS